MKKVVLHFKASLGQWIALGILLAAMFSASRGAAAPALWALGRFILPVVIIWLVIKLVKSRVSSAVQKFQEQMMQGMPGAPGAQTPGRTGGVGQVLDLCPKCGSLMNHGHKCK